MTFAAEVAAGKVITSATTSHTWDAVVLGLGGVGSFALRALAKSAAAAASSSSNVSIGAEATTAGAADGPRYLGIEQFALGHHRGSSHGKIRIYRRAYFENPQYVPWIEFSIQEFQQLERDQNVPLLSATGLLIVQDNQKINHDNAKNGSSYASAEHLSLPSYIQNSMNSAREHNIPVQLFQLDELKQRYPFLHFPPDTEYVGLLEPGAGFVRCEKAVAAALREAKSSPYVTIWDNSNILPSSLQEIPNSNDSNGQPLVALTVGRPDGSEERLVTRKLLVAAGAWTSQLIPSWSQHLTVTRQLQMWIKVKETVEDSTEGSSIRDPALEQFQPDPMPAWFVSTPHHLLPIYGMPNDPQDDDAKNWIKLGIHGRSNKVDDPGQNPTEASPNEIVELQKVVPLVLNPMVWNRIGADGGGGEQHIPSSSQEKIHQRDPQNVPNLCHIEPCMYTMTPDDNFIIGVPNGFQSVFGVGGLSGHGFKMVPALGQMLAEFALGHDLDHWKADFCSPLRFDNSDSTVSPSTK
jgi:sarcosine oxidase